MANDIVNTFSDALFEIYNRPNGFCKKGSQAGWRYCETETGVRIFQEAAEPYITNKGQSGASFKASSHAETATTRPVLLKAVRAIFLAAVVVICCALALAWQAHRQVLTNVGGQKQDTDIGRTWRDTAQQFVQSVLGELRILNTNQVALGTSQAQFGTSLAKLTNTNAQLMALASSQVSASRGLATSQAAMTQETTNLMVSLRRTFQQGLDEAGSQQHTDTAKLQKQIAELLASQKDLLARLAGSTNVPILVNTPNLMLALPGVRTQALDNAVLITFDDGLFTHGTHFKWDAQSRLQTLAKALAQFSTPLRIEVIGCADDDRTFRSWTAQFEESLGLERATAVVNYFIKLGLISPKRLAALSSGAINRPFASDTVQNRAKNRTAVFRISIDEKRFSDIYTRSIAWNR